MKYVNAMEILHKGLISEIQKYVEVNIIYIPNKARKRTRWGEKTGVKIKCKQRNNEIRNLYRNRYSLYELSKKILSFC